MEFVRESGVLGVTVHRDDAWVHFADADQGIAIGLPGGDHVPQFVGRRRIVGRWIVLWRGKLVGRRDGVPDTGLGGGLQFRYRPGRFLFRERPTMPAFLVLSERDPLALQSFRQDDQRLGAQPDRGQYFQDFLQVMPVNLLCAPAESLEALLVHVETVPECGWLALAKPVDIHQSDEIVQLINAAQRSSFPHPALGALTISHQNIGAVIQLVESRAQRHADAGAQSLSEGACRHVHERQARCRMAFEVAAELAKLEQFLRREKPRLGPGRIEQRRGMTLGKNEPVVVVIMRVLRVKAHVPEE